MKYLHWIPLFFLVACNAEKKEDTIQREIKLKEIRKGHDVTKLIIMTQNTVDDTSEIQYQADIKTKLKDSTIHDSIFLIKGAGDVLLPFSTKIP